MNETTVNKDTTKTVYRYFNCVTGEEILPESLPPEGWVPVKPPPHNPFYPKED